MNTYNTTDKGNSIYLGPNFSVTQILFRFFLEKRYLSFHSYSLGSGHCFQHLRHQLTVHLSIFQSSADHFIHEEFVEKCWLHKITTNAIQTQYSAIFWQFEKILKLEDDIFDTFLIVQAETAESTTACTFNLPMIQYT